MKWMWAVAASLLLTCVAFGQNEAGIYHDGWIDFNKNGKKDIYEDSSASVEKRLDDLLGQMTMEEKTCQMVTLYGFGRVLKDELPTPQWKNELWKDGLGNIDEQLNSTTFHPRMKTQYSYPYSKHAIALNTIQKWFIEETRLGIPVDFTNEGIRGLAHDRATCFPANIGTGSTWDKGLVREMGRIIGEEARVLGYTNVYAPILDMARDPRWGRTVESYGEDPYLVAQLGMQMVRGIQSNNVVSTCKHYAVYSVPKGGRDGDARTDPHVALREVYNIYLYPFEQAFRVAGAMGTMSSYNDYDGVPITASKFFLTELLRKKFNFKGYVVSDSDAVKFIYSKHHVAGTYKDAVRQAVEAGLNIRTTFTPPEVYVNPLRELIREGQLSESLIDSRVRDVLRVKFWLGLFDKPYVENPKLADEIVRSAEHVKVGQRTSRECLVLLKNEDHTLPLDRAKLKRILVTGPNAEAVEHSMSRYGPNNTKVVSVLEGLRKKLGSDIEIKHAKGCSIKSDNWLDLELMYTPPTGQEKQMIDEAADDGQVVRSGDRCAGRRSLDGGREHLAHVAEPARLPGRLAQGRSRDGHACRTGADQRPAHDDQLGRQKRTGHSRSLVPGRVWRRRDRRRVVRRLQPRRQTARDLPKDGGTDSLQLPVQARFASGAGPEPIACARCTVSVWPWAQLHHVRIQRSEDFAR